MTALTHNQKYQELLDQLTDLNDKYDKFINGKPSDTVYINGGPSIKSLSGIAKDLKGFKYVQRVINHRLYTDMVADTIEDGLLVRIWGDTQFINGLYLKDSSSPSIYTKVSYSDLYDLRDFLPDPWNYSSITKDQSEFNKDLNLCGYTVSNSAFETNPRRITGSIVYTMDGVGARGSLSFDFALVTVTGSGNTDSRFEIKIANRIQLSIDDGFNELHMPELGLSALTDALNTNYTITTTPFKTPDGQDSIPARLTVNFYHVDKTYKTIS